ncbi:MAG: DNA-binding protein [Anaerolineales bacterium]|nr:MAG: DNA-binding protein [Anaerolineales bacterium]
MKTLCRKGELLVVKVGRAWRIRREDLAAYLVGGKGEESQ